MSGDYATVEDLALLWRPLEESESARATLLLTVASYQVWRWARSGGVTIPESGPLRDTAKLIVTEMVADAMIPAEERGRVQWSTTVGGISESVTVGTPAATLRITDTMLELLGVGRALPRGKFGNRKRDWP